MSTETGPSRWARLMADRAADGSGVLLGDVVTALNSIAPLHNAGDWDNVGLLVGDQAQRVQRALVTIDLTASVLAEAAQLNADLIIAYHPPIFSGVKRFTKVPIVQLAASVGCAVYSPHTALDAAPGGTNSTLASLLGLKDVRPLEACTEEGPVEHKLVTFVPASDMATVLAAMHWVGAGVIGEYDCCAFQQAGTGSFRCGANTNPTIGTPGERETVEEARVEVVVPPARLEAVVAALREAHPYEEAAFDIYPRLPAPVTTFGMGRIGSLPSPMTQDQLVTHVKKALGLGSLMVATPQPQLGSLFGSGTGGSKGGGREDRLLSTVAMCAGSGSSMLDRALQAGADVFLTGEMSHHDALRAAAAGITVVCTLHSNSERGTMAPYADRIREEVPGIEVTVSASDRDPYNIV